MDMYPKIDTVFNRDIQGTKKLIPGSFRSIAVESLDNCGYKWDATEKIDGTNIRVHWDGHQVSFGGRTDRAQIPAPLLKFLEKTFGGSVNEELFEQIFKDKEVTLYGEGYGPGIQKGGTYRKDVNFILFDVKIDGLWLLWDDVQNLASTFRIDSVPYLGQMTLDQAINYVTNHPVTKIPGGTAFMEGLVLKSPFGLLDRRGNRLMIKIKWEDFKPVEG